MKPARARSGAVTVGVLFFYAGKEKIFDGLGAPAGIEKQFSGTFLATIPGVDAAWTILGILEFAIFVLTGVSPIRLEFMPTGASRSSIMTRR